MSRRPSTPSLLRLAFAAIAPTLLAAGLAAQAQDFPIGSKGASVQLDAPWQRKQLDTDLGDDQFQRSERRGFFSRSSEVYVVVMEIAGILENEADYAAALDDQCSEGNGVAPTIVKEVGWTRASRVFDATLDGVACAFRNELLVGDGLAYHVMTWSVKSQRKQLDEQVAGFVAGFEFPGVDSAHGKGLAPTTRTVVGGEFALDYTIRPSLLREAKPDDDELAEWRSGDEEQLLALFTVDGYRTLTSMVDGERDALRKWDATYKESARGEFEVDGVRCAWLLGGRDGQSIKSVHLPLGGTQSLTVRWLAKGAVDAFRPAREALFQSLRLRRLAGGVDLPALPAATPAVANTALDRFLRGGAERLSPIAMPGVGGAQRAGDGWLLWNWRELHEVTADGHRQLREGDEGCRFAAKHRGQTLVGGHDGAVRPLHGDTLGAPMFDAEAACVAGDDLWLLRRSGALLEGVATAPADIALVRRAATGGETTLGTFPCGNAAELAIDATGSHLLVRVDRTVAGWLQATPSFAPKLLLVPLAAPTPRELGEWTALAAIAAASDGWLVTGTPRGAAAGVWMVRNDGSREPLLLAPIGGLRALAADATSLTVLAATGMGQQRLVVLARDACRRDGVRCQPFANAQLAAIGSRLLGALGSRAPRTAAEVQAARRQADVFTNEIAGAPLPTSPDDVETLLTAAADWDDPLPDAGRALLGVLTASAALAAGGEWVEGATTDWSAWRVRAPTVYDTPFAIVVQPGNMVTSALDDSESYATLTMDTGDRQGRPLLVGLDPAALRARVLARMPAEAEAAVRSGDVATLRRVLEARSGEHELRRHVYGQLAAHGQHEALRQLASRFALGAEQQPCDLVAWIAAGSRKVTTTEEAKAWMDAALDAVRKAPREAALYLWLGRAVDRAFPDEPQKSRPCYERALELAPYGDVAASARKALGRER
ncbi:MAG: hypothetical protein INH34_15210 [Phycisphaerales bacterium]|nr:hypothetical protein [Phycisphaerales bacterium]